MGFVVLGAATFTVGGVQAAVYASVAHGLITGLLFFLAGAIKDRYGTTDLARLRVLYGRVAAAGRGVRVRRDGLARACPGWPGSGARCSRSGPRWTRPPRCPRTTYAWLAFVAALGIILTSAYFLAVIRGMLQGGPVRPVQGVDATVELVAPAVTDDVSAVRTPDLHALEWVAWSPLLAAHPGPRCRARTPAHPGR